MSSGILVAWSCDGWPSSAARRQMDDVGSAVMPCQTATVIHDAARTDAALQIRTILRVMTPPFGRFATCEPAIRLANDGSETTCAVTLRVALPKVVELRSECGENYVRNVRASRRGGIRLCGP